MMLSVQAWGGLVLAALAGLAAGWYGWRVAVSYDRLLGADAVPDWPLLRSAMVQAGRPLARTPGQAAGAHLAAYVPGAVLAVAFAMLQARFGPGLTLIGLASALFVLMMLALIDARCGMLPDALTLPLFWTGLALALAGHGLVPVQQALATAMAAYAVLWLFAWSFSRVRGRDGLGGGDIKLVAAAGAWVGWPDLFLVVLLASVSGLLTVLILTRSLRGAQPYPFGPHLVGATFVLIGLRVAGY